MSHITERGLFDSFGMIHSNASKERRTGPISRKVAVGSCFRWLSHSAIRLFIYLNPGPVTRERVGSSP